MCRPGVSVVISLFLIYWELANANASTTSEALALVWALAVVMLFSTFFLVMVGYLQYFIVWWVVALNFDSVDRVSFLINAKTEEVMTTLSDEFLDVWEFSRRKDNPKAKKNAVWVLKCRDTYGNRVILTIGSHSVDKNKCILATVAFHRTLYSIESSKSASGMRTSIINDVKERLLKSNPQLNLTQLDAVDDLVSSKAYSHALALTCPKTEITKEFLRNIPRYYLYGIIITLLALVFMIAAFALRFLDISTFVGAVIVLVVALLAELGVSLREELSRQEVEELD